MVEELRSLVKLLENSLYWEWGFFYEYGLHRSFFVISVYSLVCFLLMLKERKRKKLTFTKSLYSSLIVGGIGSFFSYYYFGFITLADYSYFYPPTTNRRFDQLVALSLLYGLTTIAYYSLLKNLIGESNRVACYLCILFLITSPLQLWTIFSSPSRDFTKAPIIATLIILSLNLYKEKIRLSRTNLFFCASFMVLAMTFRQDVLIYIPLIFLSIFLLDSENFTTRLKATIGLLIFFLPGCLYIILGFDAAFERATGRFIPGMGEDVIRTFFGEPSHYVGPFKDLNAEIVTKIAETTGIASFYMSLVVENVFRIPTILKDTAVLPLLSNHYPHFFLDTFSGRMLEKIRFLLSYEVIYLVGAVIFVLRNLTNFRLLMLTLALIIYFSFINGLQFLHKNIFHFEILSYILFYYGSIGFFFLVRDFVVNFFVNRNRQNII